MPKLHLRVGVPLLIAVLVVAVASFVPALGPTRVAQAACSGTLFKGVPWLEEGSYAYCASWIEVGCFLNPTVPDHPSLWHCNRSCRKVYDSEANYCGTECWEEGCEQNGCCEPQ